ncbi:hypothetical protein E2320_018886 [Naja naja]|nr:hypothetical protein E2320_018886 [Naja naja]
MVKSEECTEALTSSHGWHAWFQQGFHYQSVHLLCETTSANEKLSKFSWESIQGQNNFCVGQKYLHIQAGATSDPQSRADTFIQKYKEAYSPIPSEDMEDLSPLQ